MEDFFSVILSALLPQVFTFLPLGIFDIVLMSDFAKQVFSINS